MSCCEFHQLTQWELVVFLEADDEFWNDLVVEFACVFQIHQKIIDDFLRVCLESFYNLSYIELVDFLVQDSLRYSLQPLITHRNHWMILHPMKTVYIDFELSKTPESLSPHSFVDVRNIKSLPVVCDDAVMASDFSFEGHKHVLFAIKDFNRTTVFDVVSVKWC